ncbi:hypothetical protein A3F66_01745 [candidate division TM6 bacterium RIFCSPHIGHO2_12_FULL_32_22]|nr:MAG: hypothetical protein A3F66_01745 [candidate division TM6 bacterium RIFCSPHIGHO2_12_FULL_32_22]
MKKIFLLSTIFIAVSASEVGSWADIVRATSASPKPVKPHSAFKPMSPAEAMRKLSLDDRISVSPVSPRRVPVRRGSGELITVTFLSGEQKSMRVDAHTKLTEFYITCAAPENAILKSVGEASSRTINDDADFQRAVASKRSLCWQIETDAF